MEKRYPAVRTISNPGLLEPGMDIVAIHELKEAFNHLSSDDCKQLIFEFEGAKATVLRKDKERVVTINELKEEDSLIRITDLVKANKKFKNIDDQLISKLNQSRYKVFQVLLSNSKKTEITSKHQEPKIKHNGPRKKKALNKDPKPVNTREHATIPPWETETKTVADTSRKLSKDQADNFLLDIKRSIQSRAEDTSGRNPYMILSPEDIKSKLSYQKFREAQSKQSTGFLSVMRRSIETRHDERRLKDFIIKKAQQAKKQALYKRKRPSQESRLDAFIKEMKKSIFARDQEKNSEGNTSIAKIVNFRKPARISRQEQVDQANNFLEEMRRSIAVRADAAGAIEDFMDKARRKKVDWQSINYYIDFVVKNSSSTAMAALANIKASDQTYGHCIDVASIFSSIYLQIKKETNSTNVFKTKNRVMLAAFLHDFGKSQIPKDIIDSPLVFPRDSEEMQLMQSHPTYGAKLLVDKMNVTKHFINMTLYHHVKVLRNHLNSYPEIKKGTEIFYETRLLSIVDVYQALIGKRNYKKPTAPAAAMHLLKNMSGPEFDRNVFNDFRRKIGDYPIGTLVKLNDESIGFVVTVPEIDLNKPNIVLIKDSDGKELNRHTLIDLETERDIYITQELNTKSVLGDAGADIFRQIQVS